MLDTLNNTPYMNKSTTMPNFQPNRILREKY